jgi:all-trans-8'-apo-beta-carotenal 15,15'-oxygenase
LAAKPTANTFGFIRNTAIMKIFFLILLMGPVAMGLQPSTSPTLRFPSPVSRSRSRILFSAPTTSDNSATSSGGINESEGDFAESMENEASTAPGPTVLPEVDFKSYANGYKTVFAELPFAECQASVGSIPSDLKGSYFRCGPAMFSAGSIPPPKTSIIQPRDGPPVPDGQNPKRMVQHPFEADGGMLGITFPGDGTATARFRYVRTVAFTNERRKGQRLYRGMDSTRELGFAIGEGLGNDFHNPLFRHHLQPGLNKNRKNTSNTRAIYWGKRLLSLWEGGQPYKLDGLALSTEGRSKLGGVLEEQDPFGSKMVIDPVKNRALMYSVVQDAMSSQVTVFEFNDKFRLVEEGEVDSEGKVTVDLPGLALLSDMAVTTNYALFVQPSLSTGMQYLFVKEPGKIVTVEKAPATLHLVPRVGSGRQPMSLEIPFDGTIEGNLEFCNSYEDGNKIIFDAIRSDGRKKSAQSTTGQWPWIGSKKDYVEKVSDRSLWRYEVDLQSKTVTKIKLSDIQCYFGSVAPSDSTLKHDHIYMAIGGQGAEISPPQGVARFDCSSKTLDAWMPDAHEFCGEPMFAPKSDPSSKDDGYVLSVVFDGKAESSDLVVFEASNIAAGPVCRIPLGLAIPHGLHGCFTTSEEATWSFEEIQRRAKLADKMESRGNLWNEVKSDFSGLGLRFDDMEEYFGDSFLS